LDVLEKVRRGYNYDFQDSTSRYLLGGRNKFSALELGSFLFWYTNSKHISQYLKSQYGTVLTSCIAAIGRCAALGNDCEGIVCATDHMITMQNIGQFEHSIDKYRRIGTTNIAMLSGDALLFDEVLKDIPAPLDFDSVSVKIHENLKRIRDQRIDSSIFQRLRIDFDFLKDTLRLPTHNETMKGILDEIKDLTLNTSILLVGFKDQMAQLAEINEFQMLNARDINFNAIGSGAVQAINTLLFQRHSKSDDLKTTLYNVYKAKRNSEVAVGVGKETDLFVLLPSGKLMEASDAQINDLAKVYAAEMQFSKTSDNLKNVVEGLIKSNA